jgi:hypothetical protein
MRRMRSLRFADLTKLALGFPIDGADGRLTHIVAKIIGDCRAHARNRNPDYRRHRCDLVLVIDKFAPDARLAQLLKLLVVLVCLGAIVTRLLPLLGYSSFLAAPPATPQSVP